MTEMEFNQVMDIARKIDNLKPYILICSPKVANGLRNQNVHFTNMTIRGDDRCDDYTGYVISKDELFLKDYLWEELRCSFQLDNINDTKPHFVTWTTDESYGEIRKG